MKYYIIAGEASGDLHGSNLIRELIKKDPAARIRCWGGDKMQAAGGELVKHYRDLAFMGFSEVLMNLRTIFRNLKFCKEDIEQFQPDAIVLIDYPGVQSSHCEVGEGKNSKSHLLYKSAGVGMEREPCPFNEKVHRQNDGHPSFRTGIFPLQVALGCRICWSPVDRSGGTISKER